MPENPELQDDSEAPAKADKPEEAAPSDGEVSTEAQTDEDTSEDAKPKPKKYGGGFQKRIGDLTRQLREAQRQNERLFGLVESKEQKVNGELQPNRGDFEDYESYLDARARWVARQEAQTLGEQFKEASTKREAESIARREEADWNKRQESARKRYEDYDEVAYSDDLMITSEMAQAIKAAENGPEVAYYLGKNPGEAERISELSGPRAIIEIGRIEERLLAKAKRSGAPDPINPVRSKASGVSDPLSDKVSTEQWIKARNKKLRDA